MSDNSIRVVNNSPFETESGVSGSESILNDPKIASQKLGDGTWVRLDGKSTANNVVYLLDQYGEPPTRPVKIIARGLVRILGDKKTQAEIDQALADDNLFVITSEDKLLPVTVVAPISILLLKKD